MASKQIGLERMLQIVLAGLMVLATMLFGVGHRAPWLVWSVVALAAAAIYYVDTTGQFRLPRWWANLLSVSAVSIWLAETMVLVGEAQLVAVTYVLLFLQLVLFFQAKGERIYWQLIVLSVAQAAVASALAQGLLYAILLVGYVMLGVLALALLLMHRELARFALAAPGAPATVPPPGGRRGAAFIPFSALVQPPQSRPALHFVGGTAELPQADFRRTLAHQTAGIALVTLLVTAPVYLLFPRVDRQSEGFDDEIRSVGFSKDVTLGEQAGEATLNPDVVMRVQLFEEPSGIPFQLIGEPLFRGSVATGYSHGKWTQSRSHYTRPLEPIRADEYTRQHITIEKLDETTLFSMMPAYRTDDDDRLRVDSSGSEIFRPRSRSQRMEFDLATTGVHQRRQSSIVPRYHGSGIRESELLNLPNAGPGLPDPLVGLKAAAERVRAQAGIDPDDRIALARALEHYLRDSGEFQYTLEGQKRNVGADPIEDFVVEHRRGHCEYFAGALALMLRSQGIPARVAIGFRAGEWNSAGGYYQVRQLHAHAWVEALLEPKHYADQDLGPAMRWASGGWLVLDPTPAGEGTGNDNATTGLWRRAGMYVDYLQVLWSKYAATLDATSQQEAIYKPLGRWFGAIFGTVFGVESWRDGIAWLADSITSPLQWYRQHWHSLPGLLISFVLVAAAVVAHRGRPTLARWWRARPRHLAGTLGLARRSQSEMLDRLELCLARRGLLRLAGQTPFEFALAAGGELAESVELMPLAALPRRVVEAFYRVRFGARPLDNSEAKAVEHALRTLEARLR